MATPPVTYHTWDPPPSKGVDCSKDKDLTQQSFKEECDINNILDRYDMVAQSAYVPPQAGDFTQVPDFQAAELLVIQARQQFEALPAKVRDRFQNDPSRFLAFVNDEKNTQEAIDLGLATPKPKPPAPTVQQVVVGTLNADGTFIPQGAPVVSPSPPPTK